MKFFVIANRRPQFAPEEFAPHLEVESRRARQLYAENTLREIHSRTDGKGAILVLEAADQAAAEAVMNSLPLVEKGMLEYEIHEVQPYRGFCIDL
jgi:uncharacterized protein YciI